MSDLYFFYLIKLRVSLEVQGRFPMLGRHLFLIGLICFYQTEARKSFRKNLYLNVLVVFPDVHQPVVGLQGFSKSPNVGAHDDEVLPDLPVLVVTL